jgi:hypothetical protein
MELLKKLLTKKKLEKKMNIKKIIGLKSDRKKLNKDEI